MRLRPQESPSVEPPITCHRKCCRDTHTQELLMYGAQGCWLMSFSLESRLSKQQLWKKLTNALKQFVFLAYSVFQRFLVVAAFCKLVVYYSSSQLNCWHFLPDTSKDYSKFHQVSTNSKPVVVFWKRLRNTRGSFVPLFQNLTSTPENIRIGQF